MYNGEGVENGGVVGVQWRGGGEWGCGRCTMKRRWRMGVW